MTELSFAWLWIWLLLPLPLLLKRWRKPQQQLSASLNNVSLPSLDSQQQQTIHSKRPQQLWQWLLWSLLLAALSRPQLLGDSPEPIVEQGRDLLLAVDMSGSMQINDLVQDDEQVDRLTIVKALLKEFIAERRGDRIGMILFADHAYLASPLSFDLQALQSQVDDLVHGLVGDMTAIGEAIGMGVRQLLEQPAEQRILILLTDGQNTSGSVDPMEAAQVAADNQVVIYTVGIGADEMLQRSLFGVRKVNPSWDLDEQSLIEIAQMTGGQYFRARDQQQLQQIYREIADLNPISEAEQFFRPKKELFFWPLGLMLGLLLLKLALALPRPVAAPNVNNLKERT
ncbi:VWA domain-containing protein [Aliagarivorans taiwanensis]|uniref:VWA domain-containing protein n=1 Tax=Aliagarivorans taiwanensis TaxID=561966 RepID=UPI0004282BFC|nr:VWA domain-containing protein [Aliagarivorans taiwanensis]